MRNRSNVVLPALAAGVLTMAIIMISATAAKAAGNKTAPAPYQVKSTISNGDDSGNLLLLQSDNSFGDPAGSASYSASDVGVTSTVGSLQWELLLDQQNNRNVYLAFSKLTPVSGVAWPSAILPDAYYPVSTGINSNSGTFFVRCFDASGNTVSLLSLSTGSTSASCTFRVDVVGTDGHTYALHMSVNGSGLPNGAPPTGTSQVTCNSVASDGTGCNDWTIVPYAGSNATVADLVELGYKTHPQATVIGSYSGDTFKVHLQR